MHHTVIQQMDKHVIQILDQTVIMKQLATVRLPKDFMQQMELIVSLKIKKLATLIKEKNAIQLTIMLGVIL